ncbi:hypothetical protein ACTG9Q_15815 [Actinokineospora sp. 24-640]
MTTDRRDDLLRALRDPSTPGDARRRALGELIACGLVGGVTDAAPVLAALVAARRAPAADRLWAATELVEPASPEFRAIGLAALLELAAEPSPPVALGACEALAEWGDARHRARARRGFTDLIREPGLTEIDRAHARRWLDSTGGPGFVLLAEEAPGP